ncbi:MAG: tRNA 2-thiouridine(34) synthase MnmA [Deltaproteobacteria bacterium]|nr:tRNA 2-thiouridine(34) synthase MnmA [Deltaproteobacteria bacterium]
MIAAALSGGADSAAAAILLHDSGEKICGVTGHFSEENPGSLHMERALHICRYLGIEHHMLDVRKEFTTIKDYFCDEYLKGRTPNPCVICNRDIKFAVLLKMAMHLGADMVATGHYVRKGFEQGRYYVSRAREKNSQEYFLGLVPQEALKLSVFPLEEITKPGVRAILDSTTLVIPPRETSQDVCFIGQEGYVSFIRSYSDYQSKPGVILDVKGRVIGKHRGALHYTIGQRKGLGMGFGRKVYVLGVDMVHNTITVGDLWQWPHKGFVLKGVNYMKIPAVTRPTEAFVKVRYRQRAEKALIMPGEEGDLFVAYGRLFSPGQLAVVYDHDGAVLCAGIIDSPFDYPMDKIPDLDEAAV